MSIESPSIKSEMPRWKKILLNVIIIISLLLGFIVFLPSLLGTFCKDITPIDDVDLRLNNIIVSHSENAYFDLIELEKIIFPSKTGAYYFYNIMEGKAWDEKLVEETISHNTKAFKCFSSAAHKPKFQDTQFSDPLKITATMTLPNVTSWRKMAQLSSVRALYLSKHGKDKEALDEALNAVIIGHKIQNSQTSLIEYMVGKAMKLIGLKTIQRIIPYSNLNLTELKQYTQKFNQFYNYKNGLISAFKVEYYQESSAVDSMLSGNSETLNSFGDKIKKLDMSKISSYHFQPNKTKALFAEDARTNIRNTNKLWSEIKGTDKQTITFPWTDPALLIAIKMYLTENGIGKYIHFILAPNSIRVIKLSYYEDLLIGSTQLLMALKAYKQTTGKLPTSLSQLVPQYIQAIPTDPFDGKPLRYSSTKKIIYSVGENLIDLGGSTVRDWTTLQDPMKNPTFKIDF